MRILFLALALGLLPRALSAQVGTDTCGTWTHADVRMEELFAYFHAENRADFRDGMIKALPSGAPRQVVTDRCECSAVLRAALEVLRQADGWHDTHRLGFQHTIFRYRSYYAVLMLRNVPEGQMRGGGYAILMIFRAEYLAYLGAGLV